MNMQREAIASSIDYKLEAQYRAGLQMARELTVVAIALDCNRGNQTSRFSRICLKVLLIFALG